METARTSIPPLRQSIAANRLLRAAVLPVMRKLDKPITVTHAYTGLPLHLLSYTHKGYWYYGKTREAATMRRIGRLVHAGDTVIEAGSHIGYLAQYLAGLVGPKGRVHVFEPRSLNARFVTENLAPLQNTLHIKAALAGAIGERGFVKDSDGVLRTRQPPVQEQKLGHLRIVERKMLSLRLDDYVFRHGVVPDFLKINVQGSESAVLSGAQATLSRIPALMVDVRRDEQLIFDLLRDLRFKLSDAYGTPIDTVRAMSGTVFAIR